MKLIIADNTLESYQGHSFAYCQSIKREAEKQGINVTILATQNVNLEVKSILNAVPFSSIVFSIAFQNLGLSVFFLTASSIIIIHYGITTYATKCLQQK